MIKIIRQGMIPFNEVIISPYHLWASQSVYGIQLVVRNKLGTQANGKLENAGL